MRLRYGKSEKNGEIHLSPEQVPSKIPGGFCLVKTIPAGVVVLDIDDITALDEGTREAIRRSHPFKEVSTPSGGHHLYYQVPRGAYECVLSVDTDVERVGGEYQKHKRSMDILVPGGTIIVPPTPGYEETEVRVGGSYELPAMFLRKCRITFDEGDWL